MRLKYHVDPIRMGDKYMRSPAWEMDHGWLCLYEFYEYLNTWWRSGRPHGDTQLKMQVALFQ